MVCVAWNPAFGVCFMCVFYICVVAVVVVVFGCCLFHVCVRLSSCVCVFFQIRLLVLQGGGHAVSPVETVFLYKY